jgi:hypothetical protein
MKKPQSFRRFLSPIFEPNSLGVRTERVKGKRHWRGVIEGYELTELAREELANYTISFGNIAPCMLR